MGGGEELFQIGDQRFRPQIVFMQGSSSLSPALFSPSLLQLFFHLLLISYIPFHLLIPPCPRVFIPLPWLLLLFYCSFKGNTAALTRLPTTEVSSGGSPRNDAKVYIKTFLTSSSSSSSPISTVTSHTLSLDTAPDIIPGCKVDSEA